MMPRMATFTLQRLDLFPNTTVVEVFERSGFRLMQPGQPTGKKVTEATMTSGSAEFSGLTSGGAYTAYASVGGVDVYDHFTVDPLPLSPAVASLLNFHGLVGWSFDPAHASGTKILETAGTLRGARVWVPEPCTITNIHMWLTTKGGTLTALENGLGVFQEGTRKRIAAVAIAALIEAWEGATGEVKLPLVTPVAVGAGYVDVAGYFKGTTAPTFATAAPTIGIVNANRATNTSRFFSADTGLTTALPSTMATKAAASQPFWVGLS